MAEEGVKFTNFHASLTSSVTRSMMLTGANSHEVGLGTDGVPLLIRARLVKLARRLPELAKGVSQSTATKENGYNTYYRVRVLGHDDGFPPDDRGFSSYGGLKWVVRITLTAT
ncbi:sulfatase-like hydrolase/transferase [Vibrio lentus]|nr:sulfatase-like hydrolase/transferase [Vibrio lentus]